MDRLNLNTLRVLQWNLNGLRGRLQDLMVLCGRLEIDVLLLQETKITPRQNVRIPGYSLFRNDRTNNGGGVVIGVKKVKDINNRDKFNARRIQIVDDERTNAEMVGVKISLSGRDIALWSIYIPYTASIRFEDLNRVFVNNAYGLLVGGDFNAHWTVWGGNNNDGRGRKLYEWCENNDLVILNDGRTTRIACPPNSDSAIDVTFASPSFAIDWSWDVHNDTMGSDHLPIIATYTCNNVATPEESTVEHNPIRDARIDWNKYKSNVSVSIREINEPNPVLRLEKLNSAMWESAVNAQKLRPRSQRTGNNFSQYKDQIWFDSECVDAWNERFEAFIKFRESGTRQDFDIHRAKDEYAKKLFLEKRIKGWRTRCEGFSSSTSLNELWNMARSFRGQSRRGGVGLPRDMFETFADKLAPPLASKPFHVDPDFRAPGVSASEYWTEFTIDELRSALKQTKNKAAGLDNMKVSFMKQLPEEGLRLLLGIFNEFVYSSIVPDPWLSVRVIAIRKPNKDGSQVAHYRPICILSAVRKIFEKLILFRLEKWTEDYALVPASQMGFRRGVGTQNCLAALYAKIQVSWLKKEMLGCVFLDVASAYDGVLVDVLCRDLCESGLPQNIGVLLSKILAVRHLEFYDGKCRVTTRTGAIGLPQGSGVAPLGYNLYVRRIERVLPDGCFMLQYADDIAIGVTHKRPSFIENVLSNACLKVNEFLCERGLTVSIQKSVAMLFTKKHVLPDFNVYCGVNVIPTVEQFRYLGVIFDRKCLWGAHIGSLVESCGKRVNFLRATCGIKWGAQPAILRIIYMTTVRSVLDYGSIVFRGAAESHMIKLYRIQWRALRTCLGLMTSTHTGSVEILAGICPLDLRFISSAQRFLIRCSRSQETLWRDLLYIKDKKPNHPVAAILTGLEEIGWRNNECQVYEPLSINAPKPKFKVCTSIWEQLRGIPKDQWSSYANTYVNINLSEFLESGQCHVLYTDGSKVEQGVAAAVWDDTMHQEQSESINNAASNFTAEIVAIRMALQRALAAESIYGTVLVLSDSMAGLQSIEGRWSQKREADLVTDTLKCVALLNEQGKNVVFVWVPAHVGVAGNEKVDKIAKTQALMGCQDRTCLRKEDFFAAVKKDCSVQWQFYWQTDDLGRFCFSIIPECKYVPWFLKLPDFDRAELCYINRIIANHYCLKGHLSRFEIVPNPFCDICHVVEDVDHVLFHCTKFTGGRDELVQSVRSICQNLISRDIIACSIEKKVADPLKAIGKYLKRHNIVL